MHKEGNNRFRFTRIFKQQIKRRYEKTMKKYSVALTKSLGFVEITL